MIKNSMEISHNLVIVSVIIEAINISKQHSRQKIVKQKFINPLKHQSERNLSSQFGKRYPSLPPTPLPPEIIGEIRLVEKMGN